jgi:uncharacterized protein
MNIKLKEIVMITSLLLLSACGSDSSAPVTEDPAVVSARNAYQQEIDAYRADRLERLQLPTGWLSLVGLHWIETGTTRVGRGDDNGTKLTVGPKRIGMLTLTKNGGVTLQIEGGTDITIDGKPARGGVKLIPDSDGEPTVVGFNKGDASFTVIKRANRYALRVKDVLAPTRSQFKGLEYFDINKELRIEADFVPHEAGKTIEIMNVLGMVEPMANPGQLVFSKDGKEFRMEAVDEGDGQLFIIFADRTSGHESYPAARFVYAKNPGGTGKTIIDFNKAYNPPCAFTAFSTCPTPPAANRLDLRVDAGEKKPPAITKPEV